MGGERSGERSSDGKICIQPHVQEHASTPPELVVGREEGLEESDPKGTKGAACAVCSELKESDRPTAKRNESKV